MIYIKVHIKMGRKMDMVYIHGLMEQFTKENLKITIDLKE
jgi:hypothetical protein